MKENKKREELQSRREFFKTAVKGALPILGTIAFGPALFSSCGSDDNDDGKTSGATPTPTAGNGSPVYPFSVREAITHAKSYHNDSSFYYIKGKIFMVAHNLSYGGGAAFYIVDENESDPTVMDSLYIPYEDNNYFQRTSCYDGTTLKTGDIVVYYGRLKYNEDYAEVNIESGGYLYSLNGVVGSGSSGGSDGSETGCSNCSSACSSACGSSCSSSCSSGCSSGCSTSCTGSCSSGCSSGCSGTCKSTCTGGCSSGCTGGCNSYCSVTCSGLCTRTCSGGCDSTCYSGCLYTCRGACKGTSYRYGY